MSYQFKKLSEVELLDAVPEGAKVLAEVDGEIRRVPSNGLGSAESAVVDILPEQTIHFKDTGDGQFSSCFGWTFVDGETYTIVYDGVKYECVASDGYVGNLALTNSEKEDTGEPFAIVIGGDKTNAMMFAPTATESTVIEVYHAGNMLWKNDFWSIIDVGLLAFSFMAKVELGQNYTVVWDGKEYQCEPILLDPEGVEFIIGNSTIFGGNKDTGEPFVMIGMYSGTRCEICMADTLDTSATHTIRIYQGANSNNANVSWDNVENKPFGEENIEITVTGADADLNTTFDGLGFRWYFYCDDTLTLEQIIGATVKLEKPSVPWHGDYVISADDVMAANDNGTAVLTPDEAFAFVMAYQSGEVTLEAMGQSVTVDIPKPGLYIFGDETGQGFDDADSFTISNSITSPINPKYIPGPPEFDLTAMGLPALTLDGNPVSVECDTTELEAALAKNVVKISCTLDIGMGVTWPITGIVNAFRCNGGYQCGFVANLDGLLFWCLDIYDGTITGRIIPLATT